MSKNQQIPLKQAIYWILISILVISGSLIFLYFYYQNIQKAHQTDSKYSIVTILQTGPEKEALKTEYLAEVLGLSIDRPTNLYRFNTQVACKKILACPQVRTVVVKKLFPGTLYIDYTLREPLAFLGEYSNMAIDKERIPFSFQPFYTPKKIPDIYLGLSETDKNDHEQKWGDVLQGERTELAFEVLHIITHHFNFDLSTVKCLDVSQAFAASEGQREIIVTLEDCQEKIHDNKSILYRSRRILRLSVDRYQEGLKDYMKLREYLLKREKPSDGSQVVEGPLLVIDLRLPQLGFIKTFSADKF